MPASPGIALYVGPDGGPFTVVGAANALPVTANAGTGSFTVVGAAAQGSPPSGAAVLVGGFDGTNVQDIKTDTSGRVITAPGGPASTGILITTITGVATAQNIKATSGVLYGLNITSIFASDAWVQVFNAASGSVTLGTTIPIWQGMLPAYTANTLGARNSLDIEFPWGLPCGTAISVATTTTPLSANGTGGGTAITTTKVVINGYYV